MKYQRWTSVTDDWKVQHISGLYVLHSQNAVQRMQDVKLRVEEMKEREASFH